MDRRITCCAKAVLTQFTVSDRFDGVRVMVLSVDFGVILPNCESMWLPPGSRSLGVL